VSVQSYYNRFYRDMALVDAQWNSFEKIRDVFPTRTFTVGTARILDIGCGYGTVSKELVARGFKVYGIDIADDGLGSVRKTGFLPLKGDLNRGLPIKDDSFDVIILADVLEHLLDPVSMLMECHRILKQDGYVLITVPLYFDIIDRIRVLFTGSIVSYDNRGYGRVLRRKIKSYNYDHLRFFRYGDVLEMVEMARLKVDRTIHVPILSSWTQFGVKRVVKLLGSKFPNLFSHSLKIRAAKL
jgi:SAM-dependent methyltransferase